MVDLYLKTNDKKFVVNKDPNANLDYTWDWTDYLTAISDTIASYTITADSGLTVGATSLSGGNKKVIAYISGGNLGDLMKATCRITTAGGRVDDRSIYFNIVDR